MFFHDVLCPFLSLEIFVLENFHLPPLKDFAPRHNPLNPAGPNPDPIRTVPERLLEFVTVTPFASCGFKRSPPEMLDTFVGLKELRTPKHTADRLLPSHRTILHSHYCAERHCIWFLNWGL
ncbi:hypothetical protein CDAR_42451 [Caerostris darwini]|uniref:Uncharacterized protein n=1 Tax=Caerostris darwini TaxID=1538125 RepID=A0AAV4RM51_9ARAC|nr:hypothetical protein CDAR_42451 [Caerostris darwini]